jgi:hypothetical protein
MAMFSMSMELIHSPPDLITSLLRSVICMKPSASMVATSPVGNQPRPCASLTSGLALEVAVHDPGAAHQQVAVGLAVPGQLGPSSSTIFMSTPKMARPCFRRIFICSSPAAPDACS